MAVRLHWEESGGGGGEKVMLPHAAWVIKANTGKENHFSDTAVGCSGRAVECRTVN